MDLTQIRACNDAVSLAIQRVTESNGFIDDLLKFAWWWIVVESLLSNVSEQVVDLLLAVTDGWSSDYGTIEAVGKALNLTPALTPTFRTGLIVGVDLVFDTEKVGSKLTANHRKLSDATVSKRVKGVVVESTIRVERDSVIVGTEVSKAAIGNTCRCTIDDTAR